MRRSEGLPSYLGLVSEPEQPFELSWVVHLLFERDGAFLSATGTAEEEEGQAVEFVTRQGRLFIGGFYLGRIEQPWHGLPLESVRSRRYDTQRLLGASPAEQRTVEHSRNAT